MTDRRKGRPGHLSDEDRRIWERVARTAKPLHRQKAPRHQPEPETGTSAGSPAANKAAPAAAGKRKPASRPVSAPGRLANPPVPPPKPTHADPGGLDRRTQKRLSRGSLPIDARIDLHGMTQRAAHTRLLGFLRNAQAGGDRLVLVITGKGARTYRDDGRIDSQPGVLRRAVPEWLRTPEFRTYVSGYDSAGRGHGGEGALYVRIRRARSGGSR